MRGVREFLMTTFGAMMRMALQSDASTALSVVVVVIVHGPVYFVSVVPAGTPVFVASGHPVDEGGGGGGGGAPASVVPVPESVPPPASVPPAPASVPVPEPPGLNTTSTK